MLFLLYASDSSGPVDAAARMGLQQFKSMLQAAKVTSSSVPPEKVDALYTMLQTSASALSRSVQSGPLWSGYSMPGAARFVCTRQVRAAVAGPWQCSLPSHLINSLHPSAGAATCIHVLLSKDVVQHVCPGKGAIALSVQPAPQPSCAGTFRLSQATFPGNGTNNIFP
jgi:hypothetical protein